MSPSISKAKFLRPIVILSAIAAIAATPASPPPWATPAPPPRPTATPRPAPPATIAAPVAAATRPPVRPLQSWREASPKRALHRFTRELEAAGEPAAPADVRVAVFATEGVLWERGAVSLEEAWALDRLRSLAPTKPEWATTPPFADFLGRDPSAVASLSAADLGRLTAAAVAGLDPDEIRRQVLAWVRVAPPGRRAPADLARPAMHELLELLRSWNVRNYVLSDGPAEITRALVEALYGLSALRVIAPPSRIEVQEEGGRIRLALSGEPAPRPSGVSRLLAVVQQLGARPHLVAAWQGTDDELVAWAAGREAPFLALGFREAASAPGSRTPPVSREVPRGRWTAVVPSEHWVSAPVPAAPAGR